jgi:hypothetical protein
MPQPPRRLSRFLEPEVDEKRVDRVWASLETRPVASRSPLSWPMWKVASFAGAAVAIGAVIFTLRRPHATASSWAGVVVESSATNTMTLPDGSSVTVRPEARLHYDRVENDRVEATVERGEALFDVRHSEARAFVVHAGAFDIVDRGTRFAVRVEGDSVGVSVDIGSVEVARAHGSEPTRTLAAGESWTSGTTALPSATSPVAVPPATDSLPPSLDVPSTAPSAPSSASSAPAGSATTSPSGSPGPSDLLKTANDARMAGHPRDAAAAFDALRRHYRGDPRAGLAAFELGRLRLDSLGDPGGAAEAFADAIRLAPGASFREDAEARLVEALDRAHAGSACAAARRSYLARFPGGLHAASVAARCP